MMENYAEERIIKQLIPCTEKLYVRFEEENNTRSYTQIILWALVESTYTHILSGKKEPSKTMTTIMPVIQTDLGLDISGFEENYNGIASHQEREQPWTYVDTSYIKLSFKKE